MVGICNWVIGICNWVKIRLATWFFFQLCSWMALIRPEIVWNITVTDPGWIWTDHE